MITAHLPSGYCLAKTARLQGLCFTAAMIGAVLPDFDILFFYFVDDQSIHHHRYWVHIPGFWVGVAFLTLPLLWRSRYRPVALAFFAGIGLHLILDSLSGGIMWLWPWKNDLLHLVTVPAHQPHWILSFLLHWTFLPEIAIWIWAGVLFFRKGPA